MLKIIIGILYWINFVSKHCSLYTTMKKNCFLTSFLFISLSTYDSIYS